MCSTPFGITAVNTASSRKKGWRTYRAQRLSASLRSTRYAPRRFAPLRFGAQRLSASLRSTPGACPSQVYAAGVLNAFRHHCGQHTITPGIESIHKECSTPFGITAVNTWPTYEAPDRAGVLNAFRHHCGQHPPTGQRMTCYKCVLNAFRHHCGQHLNQGLAAPSEVGCSTPFGITAVNTTTSTYLPNTRRACSTPFGITAVNTSVRGRPFTRPSSAQRLSASLRSTRGGKVAHFSSPNGAQRLSASLRSTHGFER